jgi:hypothetical protein
MKTYLTEFNEYQRLMFIQALEQLVATQPELLKSQPGDESVLMPEENRFGECQAMISILEDLPNLSEQAQPGDIQGLCF